jgi:hypothetical protein
MRAIDCAGLQLDNLKRQPGMAPMRGDSYRQCAFVWRFFFFLLVSEGVRRGTSKGPRRTQGGGQVMKKSPWSRFEMRYRHFVIHRSIGVQLWMLLVRCDCVLPIACFEN